MAVNLETSIKFAHTSDRILEETKRRKLVRNMEYFPGVKFQSTETALSQNGQKAPFPQEAVWRTKKVGALVRMDLKTIPIGLSKYSVIKYVLHVIDSRSVFCG